MAPVDGEGDGEGAAEFVRAVWQDGCWGLATTVSVLQRVPRAKMFFLGI